MQLVWEHADKPVLREWQAKTGILLLSAFFVEDPMRAKRLFQEIDQLARNHEDEPVLQELRNLVATLPGIT